MTETKPKKKKRILPPFKRILAAAERMDGTGFCRACGTEADGIEPDARNYPCEGCGADRVWGAEELCF